MTYNISQCRMLYHYSTWNTSSLWIVICFDVKLIRSLYSPHRHILWIDRTTQIKTYCIGNNVLWSRLLSKLFKPLAKCYSGMINLQNCMERSCAINEINADLFSKPFDKCHIIHSLVNSGEGFGCIIHNCLYINM